MKTLYDDLKANLRKPDCGHRHVSFPGSDVQVILAIIVGHPDEVLDMLANKTPIALDDWIERNAR